MGGGGWRKRERLCKICKLLYVIFLTSSEPGDVEISITTAKQLRCNDAGHTPQFADTLL